MSAHRRLRAKTFILIFLMVLFGPLGDVLLRKGMLKIGAVSLSSPMVTASTFVRTFANSTIWLGILSLLLFFVCYMLVLSWADYSFVSPASASGYAVVALLGWILLGEVVTSIRWTGVAVICLGVMLVGHTPPCTTEGS